MSQKRFFHFCNVKVVCARINITEDGSNFLPLKRMGGSDKGEGRNDDFAFESQSPNNNFQSDGRVTHRYAMLDTNEVGEPLLKLLHVRPVVTQPTPIQKVLNASHQSPAVPNVRPTDMELVAERRNAAENG